MSDLKVTSYRKFLRDKSKHFVRVPKKLLADPKLTAKQKIAWIVLASFLYTADGDVYPGRDLLARILNVKNPSNISRLTRALQDGAYLEKFHHKSGSVLYELYLHPEIDETIFFSKSEKLYRPSKRNRIRRSNK